MLGLPTPNPFKPVFKTDTETQSTRPYLLRAIYEWCSDNGLTPYIAVAVDNSVQVPREYVKNNEIVLNISLDATSSLKLGNEYVEFKARFAGIPREIMVPLSRVIAIYALENGQGMAFPAPALPVSAGPQAPERPARTEAKGLQLVAADTSSDTHPEAAQMALALPGSPAFSDPSPEPPVPPKASGRPALKRIK